MGYKVYEPWAAASTQPTTGQLYNNTNSIYGYSTPQAGDYTMANSPVDSGLFGGSGIGDTSIGAMIGDTGIGDMLGGMDIGDMSSLAGVLLQGYNSFFGPQSDLMKEKIGMLRDQRAANQEALGNQRAVNTAWAKGSNAVMGGSAQPTSLAASQYKQNV